MAEPTISPEIIRGMKKRYRDAYLVSKVTVRFGNLIKIIGVLLAGIIVVGALVIAGITKGGIGVVFVGGILVGGLVGLLIYLLGVLVAAQGQVLQATLDSAVNSSPFLMNEERAEIMSLATQVTTPGESPYPQPGSIGQRGVKTCANCSAQNSSDAQRCVICGKGL